MSNAGSTTGFGLARLCARRAKAFVSDRIIYSGRILSYRMRFPEESVFAVIHRKRAWGDGTSVSGGGSDLAETRTVREVLPDLLSDFDIRTMLDAPCGDFHWMSQVDLPLELYIGADIVEPIVAANQHNYGSPARRFICADITRDPLPRADLILCRDCMVHMSNPDIALALRNFKRSGARYLLATTYPQMVARNRSIVTGMWRFLDLERPPFAFPPPLRLVEEQTMEIYRSKSLGLWRFEDLPLD